MVRWHPTASIAGKAKTALGPIVQKLKKIYIHMYVYMP